MKNTPPQWDVFLSHASEDKDFARIVADGLESWGLRVWFDEHILNPGDSLRRSIDHGLANSQYGVVILSPNFFAKEWPGKELDGLVAREDGKSKVIIPIWHNVSHSDVQRFSPPLADKLSVLSSGDIDSVCEKIVRAVYRDRSEARGWRHRSVYPIPNHDLEFVILPLRPVHGLAVALGRYPVTNKQYRQFLEATDHQPPLGEHLVNGEWRGPFVPLENDRFNHDDQPVVAVDLRDAAAFALWLTKSMTIGTNKHQEGWAFLPNTGLWTIAGGTLDPVGVDVTRIHHSSDAPVSIDQTGARDNALGISDLHGNVWEWCLGEYFEQDVASILAPRRHDVWSEVEVRGGGFLDNLSKVKPFLRASMLDDGIRTKHSDLGFRVAATFPVRRLPDEARIELTFQERPSRALWNSFTDPRYFDLDYTYNEYRRRRWM